INNYESLLSNAEKRSVRLGEREIVPRLTDLHSILASTAGKIELEYVGEDKRENDLIDRLINRAVLKVWDKYLKVEGLKKVTEHFEAGWGVEVSDRMRAEAGASIGRRARRLIGAPTAPPPPRCAIRPARVPHVFRRHAGSKQVMGFRRFMFHGVSMVRDEGDLACAGRGRRASRRPSPRA